MKLWLLYLLGCFVAGLLLPHMDDMLKRRAMVGVAVAAGLVAALYFVAEGLIY